MREVIIIVPIYKAVLSPYEVIALKQLKKILGKHPICFVVPERLKNIYQNTNDCKVELFDDSFFSSTVTYSQLLLSVFFYERFSDYKFLLIYQLDAFVFSDKLLEFCSLDYDYIGAPLARFTKYWHEIGSRVGNGGLSLRKIKSFIRVLKEKKVICYGHPLNWAFNKWEDLFFGFCSTKPELNFKIPNVKIASQFSIDNNIGHIYQQLEIKLPFGCHAWSTHSFDIWKPFIESYGYKLNASQLIDESNYIIGRRNSARAYLWSRIIRNSAKKRLFVVMKTLIDYKKRYSIWGLGQDGKSCFELLSNIGIDPLLYDENSFENEKFFGKKIYRPQNQLLTAEKSILIISTRHYEKDIAKKLVALGFVEYCDFIYFSELKREILYKYYHSNFPQKQSFL